MQQKIIALGVVGVLTLAVSLLVTFPSAMGVSTVLPFVYAAAFRSVVAVAMTGLGILAVTAVCAVFLRRRSGRGGADARAARGLPPQPPAFATVRVLPLAAVASTMVLVSGAASLGVVAMRGWATSAPPTAFASADLVVLNANVLEAATPADELVETALTYEADVLAIQEVDAAYATEVARGLEAGGRPVDVTLDSAVDAVDRQRSALLTPRAWEGGQVLDGVYGTARLAYQGTALASVHTVSPLSASVLDGAWRASVEETAAQCEAAPRSILAGDFNSTLDHAPLRARGTCRDAATELGLGGRGTWRSDVPEPFASAIDHQLYDPRAWQPVAGAYVPLEASDHRGLVIGYAET